MINLVGNAIKFTKQGGVNIRISIVKENKNEIELNFAISDTGIGIPEDSLAKIFDGFTQASNDTTRKYGGTGLGLTITKQLIDLQKGKIFVQSTVNEGSTFSFHLKFKKHIQINDPVLLSHNEGLTERFPLSGLKVLLVEDNFFNQMLASKILENWKCVIEIAGNGNIAIEKAREQEFDLVLMDIQLPELDGYETTKYIREHFPEPKNRIPIIAMTAHAFANEVEKCLSFGMNDYISKPFEENLLYEKILKTIKNKRHSETGNELKPTKRLDLKYLEENIQDDAELILKMILVFLEQIPGYMKDMNSAIDAKDWKALRKLIHKMLPSMVFIGVSDLEEILTRMDDYLTHEVYLEQLPALSEKAHQICSDLISELESERRLRES